MPCWRPSRDRDAGVVAAAPAQRHDLGRSRRTRPDASRTGRMATDADPVSHRLPDLRAPAQGRPRSWPHCLEQVPAGERIVLVEDSWSSLPGTLMSSAWRLARPTSREPERRPCASWSAKPSGCDRIDWASRRGAWGEVVDLLAALNTGHEAAAARSTRIQPLTCPRAHSARALALAAGLDRAAAAHAQLAAGVGAVLHLRRTPRGRLLTEISAPSLLSTGLVGVEPLISWSNT